MTEHTAQEPAARDSETLRPSPAIGQLGMALFLVSLSILFAASMVGYVVIRLASPTAPPAGTIRLPAPLWASTAIILVSSATIHYALRSMREDRYLACRNAIITTLLLATAFLCVQAPSLYSLLQTHREHLQAGNVHLYGLVLVLIGLHAAHVVGGVIPLAVITANVLKRRYTPDACIPVACMAMYWHFLDIVWLVMFTVLSVTG